LLPIAERTIFPAETTGDLMLAACAHIGAKNGASARPSARALILKLVLRRP
jgi:hypothetical protein